MTKIDSKLQVNQQDFTQKSTDLSKKRVNNGQKEPQSTHLLDRTVLRIVLALFTLGLSELGIKISQYYQNRQEAEKKTLDLQAINLIKNASVAETLPTPLSFETAVDITASKLGDFKTPFEKIRYLLKTIDNLKKAGESETNPKLAIQFIEAVFNKYENNDDNEIPALNDKIFELVDVLNSKQVQEYKYNGKLSPGHKSKIIAYMIVLEIKNTPKLQTDEKIDAAKLKHFIKDFLTDNAKELYEAKFNLAHLIDALKTIDSDISIQSMLSEIKADLFKRPYQAYMIDKKYTRLDTLKTSLLDADTIPTQRTFNDNWDAAKAAGIKGLILNEYMTFGWGDCGFIASHVPRSFIREFIKDENNAYLFRLFVTSFNPTAESADYSWTVFKDIVNSDDDYLHESHVTALVNLFQNKQLFFLSPNNGNTLIEMSAIDNFLLPDHTKRENQYFIRHSSKHYTYAALPEDISANHIGRLKAQLSQTASDVRRDAAPSNQSVESLNFTAG